MRKLPIPSFNIASEIGTPMAVTLGAGTTKTIGLVPESSNGKNIVGVRVDLEASIVQSVATTWNVGQLFQQLTVIANNSDIRLDVQGYKQLVRLYNLLTGLDDTLTKYFNNPSSAGVAGSDSLKMSFVLPLEFKTAIAPQFYFKFNPLSTVSATSGSITTTMTYLYSRNPVKDDFIEIITTPTALNALQDQDVTLYLGNKGSVNELYFDITADTNLQYQKFTKANEIIFEGYDAFLLRGETTPPNAIAIDGFFKAKTPYGVNYQNEGTTGAKPKLIMKFTNVVTPTFYLVRKVD